MRQACDLLIFFQVFTHKPVDPSIELYSLRLKVFNLPFKRGVLGALGGLETIFSLVKLALKVLLSLLLQGQFVFNLRAVALLVLFKIRQLVL